MLFSHKTNKNTVSACFTPIFFLEKQGGKRKSCCTDSLLTFFYNMVFMLRDILDVIAFFFVQDKIFCLKNNLLPLDSLEQYVSRYKHLPDIPTETEVTENGIDVGAMNAKLLQKIE